MLLIEVILPDSKAHQRLVEITLGEDLHLEGKTEDGHLIVHSLMSEDQFDIAKKAGFACKLVQDYSVLPDPRDEVSKTDRFADEVRLLRSKKGEQ